MSGGLDAALRHLIVPAVGGLLAGYAMGRWLFLPLALRALVRRAPALSGKLVSRAASLPTSALLPAPGSPEGGKVQAAVEGALRAAFGSREAIYAVRNLVETLVTHAAGRRVGETAQSLRLEALLAEKVLPLAAELPRRDALAAAAGELVAEAAGTALDEESIARLTDVARTMVPSTVDAIVGWLHSAESRASLSDRGRELLPRILEKLSDLQKLFLTAGQFDRRLNEKMPEIVDETVRALEKMVRDPREQERLLAVLAHAAGGWRDSLLMSSPSPVSAQGDARRGLEASATHLADRMLQRLQDPHERSRIAARAMGGLTEDHRTIGAVARELFGIRESDAVDLMSDRILRFLTAPLTQRDIASRVWTALQSRFRDDTGATVGSLLGFASQDSDASFGSGTPVASVVEKEIRNAAQRPDVRKGLGRTTGLLGGSAGLLAGLLIGLLGFLGYI